MGTWVTLDVEVDLSEFDTVDLIKELESRDLNFNTEGVDGDQTRRMLERIYQRRRLGQDYQQDLSNLIYYILGKIE